MYNIYKFPLWTFAAYLYSHNEDVRALKTDDIDMCTHRFYIYLVRVLCVIKLKLIFPWGQILYYISDISIVVVKSVSVFLCICMFYYSSVNCRNVLFLHSISDACMQLWSHTYSCLSFYHFKVLYCWIYECFCFREFCCIVSKKTNKSVYSMWHNAMNALPRQSFS